MTRRGKGQGLSALGIFSRERPLRVHFVLGSGVTLAPGEYPVQLRAKGNDADGSRWRTAQLALAPLAPGDYVIEQSAGAETTLTAFRILP